MSGCKSLKNYRRRSLNRFTSAQFHEYQSLFSEANSETVNIETLQGKEAVKRLNPSYYFDDEVTISDDLAMLLRINNHVATLQKMYELYNSKR